MNEIVKENNIENMIYEIRGVQVMLDSDLAKLYECKNGTKEINQAVKRNMEKFPNDFYFQLSKEEFQNLESQVVTSSNNNYGGVRKIPYVFTEEGVAMLSSILKTHAAASACVRIMKAFVKMRHFLIENEIYILWSQNATANISTMLRTNPRVFTGQGVYMLATILKSNVAIKVSIEIMDAFVKMRHFLIENKDIYKSINSINLKLISHDEKLDYLFSKFNHKEIYHSGTNINSMGNGIFLINKLEDKFVKETLFDKIGEIING